MNSTFYEFINIAQKKRTRLFINFFWNFMPGKFAVNRSPAYSQQPGSFGLITASLLQGAENILNVGSRAFFSRITFIIVIGPDFGREVINRDKSAMAEHEGMLQGMFKLPDVTGPGII